MYDFVQNSFKPNLKPDTRQISRRLEFYIKWFELELESLKLDIEVKKLINDINEKL